LTPQAYRTQAASREGTMLSRPRSAREEFGYRVMGPLLANMLEELLRSLTFVAFQNVSVVFFCSRGGLSLRRLMDLFLDRTERRPQLRHVDFMVSRLAAARTALQYDAPRVASLVERELQGRSCAEAARALSGVDVGTDPRWRDPFSVERFGALRRTTVVGHSVGALCDQQANLLRDHIDDLRRGVDHIALCDTGVFGSIGRYLQLGVPAIRWHTVLLYRANYKRLPAPHFASTIGAVSESDVYLPWRPETAALLYWPLIEALLEPDVASVRDYRVNVTGEVISNLEDGDWQSRLEPSGQSMLQGACGYLAELTPASQPMIERDGKAAWSRLRRMIVYPTLADIALLGVGRRTLDFGIDDTAEFSAADGRVRSLRAKLSAASNSMWPEGELRKQFPRSAGLMLHGLEWLRFLKATLHWLRGQCRRLLQAREASS
jgi:hypothetical protein